MLLLLCIISLLSETLGASALEAVAGDSVTIWCHHDLYRASYIFWYKHTSRSVPLLVGCKQFTLSGQMQECYFSAGPERVVMSVHGKNTSLTIPAVRVSDTGLYYCSFIELDEIIFSDSSYVHVKEGNESISSNSNRTEDLPLLCSPKDGVSSVVFMIVILISGAMNMITVPLCVLLFIVLKQRTGAGPEERDNEEQLSDKRTSGHRETAASDDVYTCAVYQNLA